MSDQNNFFNINRFTPPIRSQESSSRSKPKEPPKTDKNFKKMVNPAGPEHAHDEEEISEEKLSEAKGSLFDLSAGKNTAKKKMPQPKKEGESLLSGALKGEPPQGEESAYLAAQQSKDQFPESDQDSLTQLNPEDQPLTEEELKQNQSFSLNKEATVKGHIAAIQRKGARFDSTSFDSDATGLGPKEPKSSKTQSSSSREKHEFVQEKGDLAALNAPIQSLRQAGDSIGNPEQTTSARSIQEVIDQVVKHIQTIQSQGKTDTVVTLQHPPILQGANLVLTAFEHAQKEFNIAFTNLTTAGKQFLDAQLSKESLQTALESQGYVVHMLVTSTTSEATPDQRFGRQGREDEQQQQRQGRQQNEEDEA